MKKFIKLSPLLLLFISFSVFAKVGYKPEDVEQFNSTGQCPGCDLSGYHGLSTEAKGSMDLQGAILVRSSMLNTSRQYSDFSNVFGVDFSYTYADLSYSNFSNANFSNASLYHDNFTGSDFSGADVTNADFDDSILYKCKISQAQLDSASSICDAILPDGSKGKCN
ncbi:MAG: pentapeptide repeat-containing protein [Gammaproteobacteria bacterium]|nr:pentapeptide repeat-containing protein [Gammaproteobacteria bacterium]